MVYCIQGVGYLFFIILWSIWYLLKGRHEPESYKKIYDDEPIQGNDLFIPFSYIYSGRSRFQIARSAAWLKGAIGLTVGYTWYLSLPRTSVAANTGYLSFHILTLFCTVSTIPLLLSFSFVQFYY